MKILSTVGRYLPLSLAAVAIFRALSLLGNISEVEEICLFFLWSVVILGWLGRWLYESWEQRAWSRLPLTLPLTICVLFFFYWFHLPARVIWSINRPAFQRALTGPGTSIIGQRVGMFRVLQIGKGGSDTRLVLRKVNSIFGLGDGTTFGYAYCPFGCGTRRFPAYWKVSEGEAKYFSVGSGWYAWTQPGDDFG